MGHVRAVIEEHIDGDVARAMLGQSPQCIKLLDAQGHLRFMSDNGKELMEIEDFAALDGQEWWALWPEESRETLQQAVASARLGISVCFDAPCPTAGGTLKHWRVRVSPVRGGDLDGMIIAASEDVTEEVRNAATRTALELDNLALRRFTRFVAHDLRGPIRHHKLLAEMIGTTSTEETDDTEVPVLADEIQKSAEALLDLLNGLERLHDLAEIDPATFEECKIDELVHKAADMIGLRRLTLETDCQDAIACVDPDQMLAVFANLFENTVKYHGKEGQALVRVTARMREERELEILVSDDGEGFAADRRDDILQPLVRQSNSLGISGSGLGLAMVDRIVSKHAGRVQILDTHDDALDGAIISITLPRSAGPTEKYA